MTKRIFIIAMCIFVLSGFAAAQEKKTEQKPAAAPAQPQTMAQLFDRAIAGLERQYVPLAEAMPEDKWDFVPSTGEYKGVRSFSSMVKHTAASNYLFGGAILGEKPPADTGGEDGPANLKTKADIVKYLKDSFAYVRKAVATLDDKNATGEIPSPFGPGKTTRLSMAILTVGHGFDHYGQLVEYLRLSGIIPPASRPRS